MPNWIDGTLKLRGRREDIGRFFREGVDASDWPNPKDRENQVDPFSGSGTTAAAASKHNRRWIGIDANADYCRLATARLLQEQQQEG